MLKSNLEVNISDEKTSDYFSVHDTNDDIVTSATPCSSLSLSHLSDFASKSSASIHENLDSVQNKKSVIILKKDNIRTLPMDSLTSSTWKTTRKFSIVVGTLQCGRIELFKLVTLHS